LQQSKTVPSVNGTIAQYNRSMTARDQ